MDFPKKTILHDVLEDTETGYEELKAEFGVSVADGVMALSKNSSLPRSQQIEDSLKKIKEQPIEIWMVKLADRITNLRKPPGHWKNSNINKYREDAILIYESLKESSIYLSERLKMKIDDYKQYYVE